MTNNIQLKDGVFTIFGLTATRSRQGFYFDRPRQLGIIPENVFSPVIPTDAKGTVTKMLLADLRENEELLRSGGIVVGPYYAQILFLQQVIDPASLEHVEETEESVEFPISLLEESWRLKVLNFGAFQEFLRDNGVRTTAVAVTVDGQGRVIK